MNIAQTQLIAEQDKCLLLQRSGKTIAEIGSVMKLSYAATRRRLAGARKREMLDPALAAQLAEKGLTDLAGLHSGWLIDKDANGQGSSLYFFLGPDGEKIDFADAMMEILSDIPKLPAIPEPTVQDGANKATWLAVADLHVGGSYGDPMLEEDFNAAVDDIVSRLPAAEHAELIELGDLLEANDHKGVTPNSGNPLDVKKDSHLTNTQLAIKMMRRTACRLLETHKTVRMHFIKGNHDPTSYIAVMLAMEAHFADNPRIEVVVSDEEFRVIQWGACAAFPHHGDTINWERLKDVFADQYPDEWAAAKSHRHVMTAHFHHDKRRDLLGCSAEHFRTLHPANNWARAKGLLARGSLTAMTVHKDLGEISRTSFNLSNFRKEAA